MDLRRLVFVDETGAKTKMTRAFARAQRGRRDRTLTAEEVQALRAMAEKREACPVEKAPAGLYTVVRQYAAHQIQAGFRSPD